MRELKIRAWHKNIEWDGEGSMHEVLAISFELGFIFVPIPDEPREHRRLELEDCTLRLFTGYHDKDAREIYAGDILTDWHKRLLQVVWRDGRFQFQALKKTNFSYADMYQWFDGITEFPEVIGNRYENPDLLN